MDKKYFVIIRPGLAERRALINSSAQILDNIIPIIELTKGRKKTIDNKVYHPIERYIDDFKSIFKNRTVCVDVTSTDSLMSEEVLRFYNPANGYEQWVNFLIDLKNENCFSKIIPAAICNYSDPNFEENFKSQINKLISEFGTIVYRNSISDEEFYADLDLLPIENTIYLIDCEYVLPSSTLNVASKVIARINNITQKFNISFPYIILVSTSFPNNISDLMDESRAAFKILESEIFDSVKSECNLPNLLFADYGSINPIRNDDVIMTKGWVPRIDVPLKDEIFVYRKRRPKGVTQYQDTYIDIANDCVNDEKFPNLLVNNWGIKQIEIASEGLPPSSAPHFWISVRMNIHLQQQMERLLSNNYFSV